MVSSTTIVEVKAEGLVGVRWGRREKASLAMRLGVRRTELGCRVSGRGSDRVMAVIVVGWMLARTDCVAEVRRRGRAGVDGLHFDRCPKMM